MEKRIIEWLATASFPDLVQVLNEGLRQRSDVPTDSAHRYMVGIALASETEGEWDLDLAAPPDTAAYVGKPPHGEPWCQYGQCPACNLNLCSATKHAICPSCATSVYMT